MRLAMADEQDVLPMVRPEAGMPARDPGHLRSALPRAAQRSLLLV
jgi:hypothetical protein